VGTFVFGNCGYNGCLGCEISGCQNRLEFASTAILKTLARSECISFSPFQLLCRYFTLAHDGSDNSVTIWDLPYLVLAINDAPCTDWLTVAYVQLSFGYKAGYSFQCAARTRVRLGRATITYQKRAGDENLRNYRFRSISNDIITSWNPLTHIICTMPQHV
jgi:hypothetical protein